MMLPHPVIPSPTRLKVLSEGCERKVEIPVFTYRKFELKIIPYSQRESLLSSKALLYICGNNIKNEFIKLLAILVDRIMHFELRNHNGRPIIYVLDMNL